MDFSQFKLGDYIVGDYDPVSGRRKKAGKIVGETEEVVALREKIASDALRRGELLPVFTKKGKAKKIKQTKKAAPKPDRIREITAVGETLPIESSGSPTVSVDALENGSIESATIEQPVRGKPKFYNHVDEEQDFDESIGTDVEPVSYQPIFFENDFGKIRCKVVDVLHSADMAIGLIFNCEDDLIFIPKAAETLKLTVATIEYTVYFPGVIFDLPSSEQKLMVLFKSSNE